jgi:hypothetical protein
MLNRACLDRILRQRRAQIDEKRYRTPHDCPAVCRRQHYGRGNNMRFTILQSVWIAALSTALPGQEPTSEELGAHGKTRESAGRYADAASGAMYRTYLPPKPRDTDKCHKLV